MIHERTAIEEYRGRVTQFPVSCPVSVRGEVSLLQGTPRMAGATKIAPSLATHSVGSSTTAGTNRQAFHSISPVGRESPFSPIEACQSVAQGSLRGGGGDQC